MDRLIGFWREVSQVWNEAVFDVGIGPILLGLVILLVFVFARGVFSKLFIGTLSRLARRSSTDFDDKLIAALERPAKFVFVVVGL